MFLFDCVRVCLCACVCVCVRVCASTLAWSEKVTSGFILCRIKLDH